MSDHRDQRKVVIFQRDESEVWLISSREFDAFRHNFNEAESDLERLKIRGDISSWQRDGDMRVVIQTNAHWSAIEDKVLEAFLLGICGVECDIALHDPKVDTPRRRFKVRTSPFEEDDYKRVLTEVTMAHA